MHESPIFSRSYQLLLWLIPATGKFPRTQRHLLAKRVQEAALSFHDYILQAALAGRAERAVSLARAEVELARLRFALRLCLDLAILSVGQYEHVTAMVTEVGRLLGGWKRSLVPS